MDFSKLDFFRRSSTQLLKHGTLYRSSAKLSFSLEGIPRGEPELHHLPTAQLLRDLHRLSLTRLNPSPSNSSSTTRMSVQVALETPLSQALNAAIQPKLVEVGWSTGSDDDSALSEYIILMLVNGKTQEQIALELSGDLLNLGPDDPGARDFSQWLFEQVAVLNAQLNGGDGFSGAQATIAQGDTSHEAQDAEMGDASQTGEPNVYAISLVELTPDAPDLSLPPKPPRVLTRPHRPTGPKSMRNGNGTSARSRDPRDKRMLGHLAKAMDRTSDAALHRVRPQAGTERVNTHRVPPSGPRQQHNIRGASRIQNGRGVQQQMGRGSVAGNIMGMTHEQQMNMLAMYEQQAKLMAQIFTPEQLAAAAGVAPVAGNSPMNHNFPQHQQQGRSLFDRVQQPQRQNGFRNNQGIQHDRQKSQNDTPSSSMDVQMSQETAEPSPDTTCRYNLSCTNKDCKFAHQSPAAPPGTTIDVSDECSFGAACKNRKCTGRHPSPAQKIAHQTELDCKFFPNCTNPRCPFRHPSMPLCRNGADCTTPDCTFTHVKTLCRFNPCLNPSCTFKHAEGQKRGKFEDKVWVANGAKQHVSERKFVDDEDKPEELIVPGGGEGLGQGSNSELIV